MTTKLLTPMFVIASAAKQSSLSSLGFLDCFVARAPRNDGGWAFALVQGATQ